MSSFEEKLIEEVRKYEHLYITSHKQYYDTSMKENAWREIAHTLNSNDQECRRRWTCLRDNFRKAMRARQTKSGQATAKRKPCKFEDILSFLLPFIADRKACSNIIIEEAEEEELPTDNRPTAETEPSHQNNFVDSNSTLSTPTSERSSTPSRTSILGPKQRPNIATVLSSYFENKSGQSKQRNDHLHKFFEAMEGAVRTFSPTLQIQVKSKISALVSEFELKNLEEQNDLPTIPSSRPMIPDSERREIQVCAGTSTGGYTYPSSSRSLPSAYQTHLSVIDDAMSTDSNVQDEIVYDSQEEKIYRNLH